MWRLGQALAGLSLLVALAWWASMAWAAWQGRLNWQNAAAAGLVLGLLAISPIQVLRQARSERSLRLWWSQDWLKSHPEDARWGLRAGSPWRDHQGLPVDLSVLFDFGPFLLVKTVGIGSDAVAHHWVSDRQLTGPWRWRLVHSNKHRTLVASSPSSPSRSSPLLTPTHHAPRLQKRAELSPVSDFASTQAQDDVGSSFGAGKAAA